MLENGLRGDIYQSYLLHLRSLRWEQQNLPTVDTATVVAQNSIAGLDLLFNRLGLTPDERHQMLYRFSICIDLCPLIAATS